MLMYIAFIDNEDDKDFVSKLYKEYEKLMLKVAYSVLKNIEQAEDVVNESMIKIIKNLSKFEKSNVICNKTKALIVIIVKNTAINVYRSNSKNKFIDIETQENILTSNIEKPEDTILSEEMLKKMIESINLLDDKYSSVIKLKYLFDFSNKEISETLGITDENVRIRLHRGLKILKKLIVEKGEEYEFR